MERAGLTSGNPLAGATWSAPALALGQDEGAAQDVNHRLVSPGLLRTLRIPLLRGREFSDADVAAAERVAIVSRRLAFRLWPSVTGWERGSAARDPVRPG
ncbi:MAG: hypothetical protein ACXWLR_15050 [Myxococcales bacterium]